MLRLLALALLGDLVLHLPKIRLQHLVEILSLLDMLLPENLRLGALAITKGGVLTEDLRLVQFNGLLYLG